jgi:soluble lytic murein transglycosylase-like protein
MLVAAHAKIDYRVVATVVQIESDWDATAVSPAGAVGLMQIMPYEAGPAFADRPTAEELAAPHVNVATGCNILRANLRYYEGDWRKALCAYYMGIGGLNRRGLDDDDAVLYLGRFATAWAQLWPGEALPWEEVS